MDVILSLVVMAGMLWLFLVILKGVFRALKAAVGWIGPIILAALPGVGTWFITSSIFGIGVETASISGVVTALLIAAIGGAA